MAPRVSRKVVKATAKADDKPERKGNGRPFVRGVDPRRNTTKPGPGRKPNEFKALVRAIVSSVDTLGAAEAILNNPSNPAWASAFKALTPYAYGQPTQHVAVSGSLDLSTAAESARAKLLKLATAKRPDGGA